MTWKLRKKDSRCASISVTKEQEVWGEYGIYTAHVQTPPKSSPRHHLEPKNHSDTAGARKKPILGARVPHRARQKDPKVDLQTGPRAPKSKIYMLYQKNTISGVSLGATEAAFGG